MRKTFELPRWIQHMAVGLAYLLALQLLRHASVSHWTPLAGLRLSCVLFLPRRYWPTLVLGDVLAAVPLSVECLGQFGWAWSLLHLFPAVTFAMLPVWLLGDRLPASEVHSAYPILAARHMAWLLACFVMQALFTAVDGTLQYVLTGSRIPTVDAMAGRYVLGQYLGCLMVVPIALMAYEAVQRQGSWQIPWRRLANDSLWLSAIVLGFAGFGLLTALSLGAAGDLFRQVARLAMFVPVAVMAIFYGWRGVAVGGAAASLGIYLSLPALFDPPTMMAHTLIAFSVSILLPLGAHIGAARDREYQLAEDKQFARLLARREAYGAEVVRLQAAEILEHSHGELEMHYSKLLHSLRFVLPRSEGASIRRELQALRQHIYHTVDSLFPRDWHKRGLTGALWNGPINRTLDQAGVAYYARDLKDPLNELAVDLRLTMFRLACEAVALLLANAQTSAIHLQIRGGRSRDGHSWVMLVVRAEYGNEHMPTLPGSLVPSSEQIRLWLGAIGLDQQGMEERASLYDGGVRVRRSERGERVGIFLVNPGEPLTREVPKLR